MRKIKVCGLTRTEDAELASSLGADLLGFVVADSPRQVSLTELSALVSSIPSTIITVAVAVNPTQQEADRFLEVVDRIQFHGEESLELCRRYGRRAIKAFRVRGPEDVRSAHRYAEVVGAVLLDSYKKGVAGGTGHSFTWSLLDGQRFKVPAFLAGGLKMENLSQAYAVEATGGLDLSSGLESEPGIKDEKKLRTFFERLEQLRGNVS